MKKLFNAADKYLAKCDWKDLTLIKFCLFAMGVFIGAHVLEEDKKVVKFLSFFVFLGTYVVLMKKFFEILMNREESAVEETVEVKKPEKKEKNWIQELKKDRYIQLK